MIKRLVRILIALILFLTIFTIDKIHHLTTVFNGFGGFWLPFAMYFVIYLVAGYDVIWKAVRNVSRRQFLDENCLMVIATVGAFALGIYRGINGMQLEGFDEACAVLLFYQIGEWFQKYATGKSRKSITQLMDIRPDYANLKVGNQIEKVEPEQVKVGDIIVINPGEKISLDGIIVQGQTTIDCKSLTGESLPVTAAVNNEVISGCVNLTSQIEVRVTKLFYDSTVMKILDLVENAAMKKSKSENFITKFARYYTPIVVGAAVLLILLGGVITMDWATWIYRGLSFLVVSCPCALVISIPLSFFVALGTASRLGILVKGSNCFEKLNRANYFVFDKTGTLTKGNFAITEIVPNAQKNEILRLAAIAEKDINHPIAYSIKSTYGQKIADGYVVTNLAGAGVVAVRDNDKIYCGNEKLMQMHKIDFVPLETTGTVVYVAHNGIYVGALVIQDEIKPEAHEVVNQLRALNCQTSMLTGDSVVVADSVAQQIGLSSYQASLLPQDKVAALETMLKAKKPHETLCFVGDGINDAPVLMRSDVGIAMGGVGSDAAIEAADVVLMRDDLHGLTMTKRIARKTMRVVFQNIVFSILIKVGILFFAALGFANMWLAVFGDVGVAILAILNAMRINLGMKLKKRAD